MSQSRQMIISLVCIFTIATLFPACATKTHINRTKPAEVSMKGIRTLAILKFAGQYGETVRNDFYNQLGAAKHFDLIDTTQVNAIDEVIYNQLDDPRFLPKLETLHADGVITGRVTAEINDKRGTDQVQMQEGTGQYKKGKNIFGQEVDVEIMRTVVRPVGYVVRQASLTTAFKVFDLRSKQIIATGKVTENFNQKYGGQNEHNYSRYKIGNLPARNQTLNELSAKAAGQLVKKISPTMVSLTVQFDDGSSFGFGGNDKVARGIEFAEQGAWEEAVDIWKDVIETEPNCAPAYYNLGVAYENYGDLDNLEKARQMYKKAARNGDNSLYIKAIARIKGAIADRKKLEQQQKYLRQSPQQKSGETGGVRVY